MGRDRETYPEPTGGFQLIAGFIRSGAWRQCTPTERVVYIDLADRCDALLQCYPSYDTVASDTGFTRRNLLKIITALETKGFIKASHRYNDKGVQTSNLFEMVIPFPNGPALANRPRGKGVKLSTPTPTNKNKGKPDEGCLIKHPPDAKLDTGEGVKTSNPSVLNLTPKETKKQETKLKRQVERCSLTGANVLESLTSRNYNLVRNAYEELLQQWPFPISPNLSEKEFNRFVHSRRDLQALITAHKQKNHLTLQEPLSDYAIRGLAYWGTIRYIEKYLPARPLPRGYEKSWCDIRDWLFSYGDADNMAGDRTKSPFPPRAVVRAVLERLKEVPCDCGVAEYLCPERAQIIIKLITDVWEHVQNGGAK